MKHIVRSIALAAIFAVGLAGTAGAKEKVVLAELNWTGAIAIEHVLKVVIEDRLGVDTEILPADAAVIFAGMDKGDGSVDVYTDLWMPNQAGGWNKYIEKGSRETVLANQKPYTGIQGLFIPGYIQDEHGIKSVQDLVDPDVAKLFDSDGDGKGEYWPGGPGWNSTDVEQIKAKSYGYDQYFEPFVVEQWVMEAKLSAAYKRKKPVLFYFWTPEWIHSEYDLRLLKEPAFDGYASASKKDDPLYKPDGCWNHVAAYDDPEWLEKSQITCQWPDAQVYVAYSKSLEKRAPKVAKFLGQVFFDPVVVNGWILEIGQEEREPLDVAKEWVEQNPDIVGQWLAGI